VIYLILWAGAVIAWLSLPQDKEDGPEDRASMDASETRTQGRIFSPATQGRVAGISRNGGWYE
jgi:hypothetical protein